jgi:hypothetical protein
VRSGYPATVAAAAVPRNGSVSIGRGQPEFEISA